MQLEIPLTCNLLEASENENVCGFPFRRNGWKDLMMEKNTMSIFMSFPR
jgi:hypothetical protein